MPILPELLMNKTFSSTINKYCTYIYYIKLTKYMPLVISIKYDLFQNLKLKYILCMAIN